MNVFLLVLIMIVALVGLAFLLRIEQPKANTCFKCKKEYEELEEWSFTEYCWGLRCPHCKQEY